MTTTTASAQPTIDVRNIVPRERHPLIFSTFRALAAGRTMDLVNDHDPKPLYYQFQAEMPGRFTWDTLEAGPEVWRVRIGKTAASHAEGQCCGSCAGAERRPAIAMKLTAFTDYSLRVLIYLAAEPGRRATIAEIAASFAVSESHLTKVVHFLGKQGWLANVRGKGGGLGLARPPHEIVVGEVVRATEGAAMPAECFGDEADSCAIARICRLRGVLRKAVAAFYAVLDEHTLADLVQNRSSLARILFVPALAHPA